MLAIVGDVSWEARVDVLLEGGGGGGGGALGLGEPAAGALVAMRDEGGVVSEELGALVAARAELRAWPAAAERAALYRAAARVVFPMAAEGGGEWELLERGDPNQGDPGRGDPSRGDVSGEGLSPMTI